MANDRFYLRCTTCNSTQYLGKYYPSVLPSVVDRPAEDVAAFLNRHIFCAWWKLGAHTMSFQGQQVLFEVCNEDGLVAAGADHQSAPAAELTAEINEICDDPLTVKAPAA